MRTFCLLLEGARCLYSACIADIRADFPRLCGRTAGSGAAFGRAMYFVGMTLCGFPYATVISLLVAVLSLIPILGTLISALIGCFYLLVAAPEKKIWYFIILYIVLQRIEADLLYPKIVGKGCRSFRAVGAGSGDDWREPWRCCRYDCLRTAVFCTLCFAG